MVIDWFKKVKSPRGLFAIEQVSLMYNALTLILIIVLFPQMDHPVPMIVERLAIAIMTVVLMFLYQRYPCRLTAFVRIVLQLALLVYWYPDTFEFNRLFPNLDHIFASAEQMLFACQPSVEFSKAYPYMWFSEPFNLGYIAYFPMIFLVCIGYFIFKFRQFERVSFVVITSFFIYYLIYIFVPVAGPQFYFPAIGMDNVDMANFLPLGNYFNDNSILLPGPGYDHGFFYNLVDLSHEVGERPTAAFPSSHVGITTIIMILAYQLNKKFFYFMTPLYVLLCCATVYIQAHYLIDVLAGWVSAYLFYKFTVWLYDHFFATETFRGLLK